MGLAALRRILQPAPFDLALLRGKTVAVDADNMLWSFVTAMGARGEIPTAPDGRPVAHLIGLVNRLNVYSAWGLRSAWVFDGPQPALKQATLDGRWERIEAAREAGNAMGSTVLEDSDIKEAKELLTLLGVPWLEAPCESDPQCAHFARTGQVWAAVTQDYDAALHGSPRTGRNFSGSTKRTPELMDLEKSLQAAGLTREELVDAAILIGTDYNEGVKGIGPVKAMKLIKEHGTADATLDALGLDWPDLAAVRALFLDHPVNKDARIAFKAPDARAVTEHLASGGLSKDRARYLLENLAPLHAQP